MPDIAGNAMQLQTIQLTSGGETINSTVVTINTTVVQPWRAAFSRNYEYIWIILWKFAAKTMHRYSVGKWYVASWQGKDSNSWPYTRVHIALWPATRQTLDGTHGRNLTSVETQNKTFGNYYYLL